MVCPEVQYKLALVPGDGTNKVSDNGCRSVALRL